MLDGVYRVTGSVDHPNSLSMYLCMAGPVLVAAATSNLPKFVRYFSMISIGFATVTILLTVSRAGIPIFAMVMLTTTALCVSWRITPKKLATAIVIGLVLSGLVFKSWDTIKSRFFEATLEQEYLEENTENRGMYLRQAKVIIADRIFGVGLNNWSYWVSKAYGAKLGFVYEDYDDLDYVPSKEILSNINYAAPAHNLAALTTGELGMAGLLVFALIWLRWFQMGKRFLWNRSPEAMQRLGTGFFLAIGGVFLQSLTEWVYRQTQILLTFNVVVGALASLYYVKRKQVRRRVVLPLLLAMLANLYDALRRKPAPLKPQPLTLPENDQAQREPTPLESS
ncbi:MAG: hypothetical protein DME26_18965 [Verrucomicrobia bacterium]|nr:MAG: hypothetical protein DME26_18965 [Verrucomicrobiota bacterium]